MVSFVRWFSQEKVFEVQQEGPFFPPLRSFHRSHVSVAIFGRSMVEFPPSVRVRVRAASPCVAGSSSMTTKERSSYF